MNKRYCTLILGFLATAALTRAQDMAPASIEDCKAKIDLIFRQPASERPENIRTALDYQESSSCFSRLLYRSVAFWDIVKEFQSRRNDLQASAPVGSGGTTNLVSRGLTAKALSIAAEYGALTQSVNNQVVTVRGTLGGVAAALSGQGLYEYCPTGVGSSPCLSQRMLDHLKRVSYGVSFDTSQNASQAVTATAAGAPEGTAQPVLFTASRRQITGWNARIEFLKTRDTTSKAFEKRLTDSLAANNEKSNELRVAAKELEKAFDEFARAVKQQLGEDYNNQFAGEGAAFLAILARPSGTAEEKRKEIDARFNRWAEEFVRRVDNSPEILAKARELVGKRSLYRLEAEDFLGSLADQPVLAFDYVNSRPVGQEPFSTFRLIFDKGVGKWAFAFNGAATVYDQNPANNISRWRDAQVGAQIQRDLGTFLSVPTAISLSYYFQYQNSPAIFNVKPGEPLPGINFVNLPDGVDQVFTKTGNLHLGQFRVTMAPKNSSVRVPFAISYSNRTELINKPTWRAQIGISYDFDSLFGK